jgi:hypothetical protein
MPRRSALSTTEQASLLALPESQDDLIRYYTFNEPDLSLIRQHRGDVNRLGFAIQLCLLRYPGYALASDIAVTVPIIQWVASQVQVNVSEWVSPMFPFQMLTKRGIRIEFVKEGLHFTGEDSPMANLLLSVMGAFAEFERALIRERQLSKGLILRSNVSRETLYQYLRTVD